uniref:Ig-like domain-containing protein n=1 Tax=Crocodylus porosus TaxID=8502 RepID=A0A7M4FZM4_CROPO
VIVSLSAGFLVSGSPVKGVVGQDVTLSCGYSVRTDSDLTTMCWGRGPCPTSQCSDLILWTNGRRVTQQQDNRYQLRGNLLRGDVSLTILKAREADAGTYCCRVEIHGWFNDQKTNVDVVIERGGHSSCLYERSAGSTSQQLITSHRFCLACSVFLKPFLFCLYSSLYSLVSFSCSGQGEVQFVLEHGIHQRENIYTIN